MKKNDKNKQTTFNQRYYGWLFFLICLGCFFFSCFTLFNNPLRDYFFRITWGIIGINYLFISFKWLLFPNFLSIIKDTIILYDYKKNVLCNLNFSEISSESWVYNYTLDFKRNRNRLSLICKDENGDVSEINFGGFEKNIILRRLEELGVNIPRMVAVDKKNKDYFFIFEENDNIKKDNTYKDYSFKRIYRNYKKIESVHTNTKFQPVIKTETIIKTTKSKLLNQNDTSIVFVDIIQYILIALFSFCALYAAYDIFIK